MDITLYHRDGTRSERVRVLLALLDAPHRLEIVDAERAASPSYRALHPLGTVPALRIGDQVLLESSAQLMTLADLFPQAGLAPPLGSLDRAAYYDAFAFSVATLEPAVLSSMTSPHDPRVLSWRDRAFDVFEARMGTPFMVGHRLTAVDVLTHWGLDFLARRDLLAGRPRCLAALAGLRAELARRGALSLAEGGS